MLPKSVFVKYVKDALTHLYDPISLQRHPLGLALVDPGATDQRIRAQKLRELIVEAIEQLQPDSALPFGSKEWVAYRILNHRYLEAMAPPEVAERLHVSERHLFRQHRRAVESVAEVLWDRYTRVSKERDGPNGRSLADDGTRTAGNADHAAESARQMVEHSRRQRVDLAEVAAGLQGILQPLAEEKGVALQWDIRRGLPALWLDPAVLRQIILNVAVAMLEQGGPGSMRVSACHDEGCIVSSVEHCSTLPSAQLDPGGESYAVARRLVENEGGSLRRVQDGAHLAKMLITLPIKRATVLMIDDNPDAIALFRRYLQGTEYQLEAVPDADGGLRLAMQLTPDLILLDVMMPSQDGWQVLQSLRANPTTAGIPVVVCSVLDHAGLATAAGANDLLKKPVSQQALLDMLECWLHGPGSRAAST